MPINDKRNNARHSASGTSSNHHKNTLKQNKSTGIVAFFKDRRTHLAIGVTLVVIAFVMAISTVSHLKSGALDESIVSSSMSVSEIANSGQQIHNTGGAFGAWLSHVLMVEGLGVGSFVLVIYLGIVGLSLLGALHCRFWALTFKCLFSAIAISIIIGLITMGNDSYLHWGGVHGHQVNLWLNHTGSWPLEFAVSIILAGLLVAIYYYPIINGIKRIGELIPRRKPVTTEEQHTDEKNIALDDLSETEVTEQATETTVVDFNDDSHQKYNPAPAQSFTIDEELEDVSDDNTATVIPDTNKGVEPTFTINQTATLDQQEVNDSKIDRDPTEQLPYDPRADLSRYVFPGLDLLTERPSGDLIDPEEQQKNKDLIVKTLLDYKIPIQSIKATVGPTVTLYEIVPAEGVRIAQIQRLENDIALSLAALGIRIIAPIPGAGTVGIEVPNRDPKTVAIRSIIGSAKFAEACKKMILPMAMGATISNEIFIQDLAKMPHLLVAGATGQGKSVGLNCIVASLLYAKHPSELKFVFIDPKMVEFAAYRKLERHYLAKLPDADEPIITDATKVPATLASLCLEMDNRYILMSKADVRSVEEYNRKFCRHALNPENGHKYMPYIVTIVDEFADLIMVGGKDVPLHIARIAQKGRAAGMHIIIATQRPSADVISGMIKNNFPGRIAFRVMSMVDSKTILDRTGANQLIGRGDMLFLNNGRIDRVQCAFIDTPEIDAITEHINNQIGYENAYLLPEAPNENTPGMECSDPSKRDALFNDCARFIVTQSTASTSSLQRRFSIGYNKAGKIMDQMEAAGIVGPAQGAKPRAVLMDAVTLESIL